MQNECYRKHQGSIKKTSFQYQYHPSTTNIIYIIKTKNIPSFTFQTVSIDKVKDVIKTLNTKKECPDGVIPVKLIKMNEDIFSRFIFQNSNQSLVNGEISHYLKQADVIPVFKNKEKTYKSNLEYFTSNLQNL